MFRYLSRSSRKLSCCSSSYSFNLYYSRSFVTPGPVGIELPNRISYLGSIIRTPEDLNLRLSTCVRFNKPEISTRIFEQARKERLPFNDASIEYTVFNLAKNRQFKTAEDLLENYRKEERLPPPERAYRFIVSGYARCGDFKNVQKVLYQMDHGEIPISETTYEHILHNAEKYYLEHDLKNPNYKKKYFQLIQQQQTSKKTTISNATPHKNIGLSFEEYIDSKKKQGSSGASKNKKKFGVPPPPPSNNSINKDDNNSLFNDNDILLTKFNSIFSDDSSKQSDDSDEAYLSDHNDTGFKGLSNAESHNYNKSYLLTCIMDIFKSVEADNIEKNNTLDYKEEPTENVDDDLTDFTLTVNPIFVPIVLAPDARLQANLKIPSDGNRDVKFCALTGAIMNPDGSLVKETYDIPFVDNTYTHANSFEYNYLDSTKKPISENFSVERKIHDGEGFMLQIDDDLIYSLSYDRSAVTGESLLAAMSSQDMIPNSHFFAAIINGYGRGGRIDLMHKAYEEMDDFGAIVTPAVYNKVISGYARNLDIETAELLFRKLFYTDEFKTEIQTVDSLIYANSKTKNVQQLSKMKQLKLSILNQQQIDNPSSSPSNHINPDLESSSLYLNALQNDCDFIEKAKNERELLNYPFTSQTYDSIISGFFKKKHYDSVTKYFEEMNEKSISPTENTLNNCFITYYKCKNLHYMTKCIWMLRQFGYESLTSKRIECFIDILCQEGQFSTATSILSLYKNIPSVIKPRNFSILLRELLKKGETLSIINSFDEVFKDPALIGFVMLFSQEAKEKSTFITPIIESAGYKIDEPIIESILYYYYQTNDTKSIMDTHRDVLSSKTHLVRSSTYYLWLVYCLCKNEAITDLHFILKEMQDNNISLSELTSAAKLKLSNSSFIELSQHVVRQTTIDLHAYVDIQQEKPNILDYLE